MLPPSTTSSCTPREAFQELLRVDLSSYSGEEAHRVREYDAARLAIPAPGSSPPLLADVIDEKGRLALDNFDNVMLRSPQEFGALVESEPAPRMFMDKVLQRDFATYEGFVRDLFLAGVLGFESDPLDFITPFFVEKKNGKLRVVWDCRVVNRRF